MSIVLTDAEQAFADSMEGQTYIVQRSRSYLAQTKSHPTRDQQMKWAREGATSRARHKILADASAASLASAKGVRDYVRQAQYVWGGAR